MVSQARASATINVNMSGVDSYESDATQSQKKLSVASAELLDLAYVMIKSGTCGTTAVEFDASAAGFDYLSADGEAPPNLDFAHNKSTRLAFVAEPEGLLKFERQVLNEALFVQMVSVDGNASVSSGYAGPPPPGFSTGPNFAVSTIPGSTVTTATYTVMLLRERYV